MNLKTHSLAEHLFFFFFWERGPFLLKATATQEVSQQHMLEYESQVWLNIMDGLQNTSPGPVYEVTVTISYLSQSSVKRCEASTKACKTIPKQQNDQSDKEKVKKRHKTSTKRCKNWNITTNEATCVFFYSYIVKLKGSFSYFIHAGHFLLIWLKGV